MALLPELEYPVFPGVHPSMGPSLQRLADIHREGVPGGRNITPLARRRARLQARHAIPSEQDDPAAVPPTTRGLYARAIPGTRRNRRH
jgi:hypothetical protein